MQGLVVHRVSDPAVIAGNGTIGLEIEVETAAPRRFPRSRLAAEPGAAPVVAALAGKAGGGKVVCVVSGGNLDTGTLVKILAGELP